jgi:hypothetical protein
MSEKNIVLNEEALERLFERALKTAIAAAKEPSALEQKKLDADALRIEGEQAARLRLSTEVKAEAQAKHARQRLCSHEHANGDSHVVYVQERKGPGYMLCQKNQCIIRPGVAPEGYTGNVIYDTNQFNRLFQKDRRHEMFG